jgi:predicted DNA-binding transcriptional regulator AlpA
MGRNLDHVLGIAEIAELLGVARNTAWRWSQREEFPPPGKHLASGPIWDRADVERWARKSGRKLAR